jgi:hypothetical protein
METSSRIPGGGVSHKRKYNSPDELVQLESFLWTIPKAGYRLAEQKRLIPGSPALSKASGMFLLENAGEVKDFQPALRGILFRDFAETGRNPDSVLKFANQCGWLGTPALVAPVNPSNCGAAMEVPLRLGEPLQTWLGEIAEMDRLVRSWDSIAPRNSGPKIEQTLTYRNQAIIYRWSTEHDEGLEVIASKELRPWLLERLLPIKSLESTLRWSIQIVVNKKLVEHRLAPQLLWSGKEPRLALSTVPGNLVGFLWLQFAKAIEGNVAHRRCEDCGRWFTLGGRWGDSDKRFCSGTCKTRTHRRRT